MSEIALVRSLQVRASTQGARLFRNNTGQGWVGEPEFQRDFCRVTVKPGDVLIRSARPLHAGLCVGSSDLIGWTAQGQFLAVEVKTDSGRITTDQTKFLEAVREAGGIGLLARSIEDLTL